MAGRAAAVSRIDPTSRQIGIGTAQNRAPFTSITSGKQQRIALEVTWRQRHATVPAENWLQRADTIEAEPDPLGTLHSSGALRNDMAQFEDATMTAAVELYAWTQPEIDRIRGRWLSHPDD